SGLSGIRMGNTFGLGSGSINQVTITTLQAAAVTIRADDGVPYFDGTMLTSASSMLIAGISTPGNTTVNVGDHFESTQADNSNARSLTLSVGSDNDTVDLTGNTIIRSEIITVGNNSSYPVPILPSPFVRVMSGSVGSGPSDFLQVTVGSNTNTSILT